jgi:hypothetical protein
VDDGEPVWAISAADWGRVGSRHGERRRRNAWGGVPATRGGYVTLHYAQKGEGHRVLLTEGPRQAGTRRRGDFGGGWRRGRPVLVGVDAGVLPGHPGTSVGGARRW